MNISEILFLFILPGVWDEKGEMRSPIYGTFSTKDALLPFVRAADTSF